MTTLVNIIFERLGLPFFSRSQAYRGGIRFVRSAGIEGMTVWVFAMVLCVPVAIDCFTKPAGAAEKPNIVFILADDLGYRELGSFGQKKIKTPNLDAFCKTGNEADATLLWKRSLCSVSMCIDDGQASRARVRSQ